MALAAALAIAFYFETQGGPLQRWAEWDQTDAYYYDFCARRIAGGDVLGRRIPPPCTAWQTDIAAQCFALRPGLAAVMAAEAAGTGETPAAALWRRWIGPCRYHQEPGYVYAVALTYVLCGPRPAAAVVWQVALGVLCGWLVFALTERYYGGPAAALAALLCALSAPLLMHQILLLRDGPICFAGLMLVWLTGRACDQPQPARWLLTGLWLGTAMLLKSVFAVYLLGLPLIAALACGGDWRRTARACAALAAGVALALAPLAARNIACGVPALALAGNASCTFAQHNSADYRWSDAVPSGTLLPAILAVSDNATLATIIETFKTHPGLGSVLKMYAGKFDAAWHWWARPDNACLYAWQCLSPLLGWMPVTFAVIAPPALVGLFLGARRIRRRLPLYLLVLTALAPLLLFCVMERFRLLLFVACLPFAAGCVTTIIDWLRAGRRGQAAAALGAVILVACWTARPLPAGMSKYRSNDFMAAFDLACGAAERDALYSGKHAAAALAFEQFLQCEPPGVRRMAQGLPPGEVSDPSVVEFFSKVHFECGTYWAKAHDPRARNQYTRALLLRQSGPKP